MTPSIFTDLKSMRNQECDRPRCMAIELSKTGAIVVATTDYDTLYVWPYEAVPAEVSAWHRDNNAGDVLMFHVDNSVLKVEMHE